MELTVDVVEDDDVVLDGGDTVDLEEVPRDIGEDVEEVLDAIDDVEAVEL